MMEINEACEAFFFHCRYEKNLSPKTLKAYQIDLTQFRSFLKEEKMPTAVEQLDKTVIKGYLQTLFDFRPKTTKRKVATLKALFNFLEFEDYVTVNPFRKIRLKIKEPRQLPTVMTVQEVERLFKVVYGHYQQSGSKPRSNASRALLRDVAVLEMLFATGVRVAELTHLRPGNVNLEQGHIKVLGKGSKERVVHLSHPQTRNLLGRYWQYFANEIAEADYFFVNRLGRRLSEQSVRLMVKKYAEQAQIPKAITPHIFRHTFATLLLEEQVDLRFIQSLLGHASINTTQIYAHVNADHQRELLVAKHPRRLFKNES